MSGDEEGLAGEGERVCETERAGGKKVWGFNLWITQHRLFF